MTVIGMRRVLMVIDGDKRFFADKNLATNKTRKNPAGFVGDVPVIGFWKAVKLGIIGMDVRMTGWDWDHNEPRFRAKVII